VVETYQCFEGIFYLHIQRWIEISRRRKGKQVAEMWVCLTGTCKQDTTTLKTVITIFTDMKSSKLKLILRFLLWSKTWVVPIFRCLFNDAARIVTIQIWTIERLNNDFEGSFSDLTCRKLPELAMKDNQNRRPGLLVWLWHFWRQAQIAMLTCSVIISFHSLEVTAATRH
jgi:hypothetical protein